MKKIVLALLTALPFAATVHADNLTPPEGFKLLFNGKNFDGWQGLIDPKKRAELSPEELAKAQEVANQRMHDHWKVDEGELVFDGKGDNLCTIKDYGDFELLLDWKIMEAGDSGIYLRGTPQIQIWDADHKPFHAMGADKGSGSLWNNAKHERFALVKADNKVGEWNTFRIKMVGDKVTVYLNDKLVTDNTPLEPFWFKDKPLPAKGPIELQNHGNTLYFRNLYIKEL